MVIFQKPNLPLIVAFVGMALSYIPQLYVHKAGSVIYTIAIIIWAYEEIFHGVNGFRRVLGGVVLASTAMSLFMQLH